MEVQEDKDIKKGMRTIWIIWIGIFYCLYIYIKICRYQQSQLPYLSNVDLPLYLIKYSLYGLSIIVLVVTHYIRKSMLSKRSSKSEEKIIQRAAKMNKPASVVKYTGAVVVSIALSEVIGIFGLVFCFISGDSKTLYSLIAISALAMIYFCPKKNIVISKDLAENM